MEIWVQEMECLKGIKDIQPSIVFQPLYDEFFTHSSEKGGNAMGLEVDAEKRTLISTSSNPQTLSQMPPPHPGHLHLPTLHITQTTKREKWTPKCNQIPPVFSLAFRWSSPLDDQAIDTAASRIFARVQTQAEAAGQMHPFIYQNYANASQDVFAGYGPTMRESLREVQRSVDPDGKWRALRRGYFTV
jgi:hypothetical protein